MTSSFTGLAVLLAFTLAFVGICVWVLWPSRRSRMKSYGNIPLEEDEDHG